MHDMNVKVALRLVACFKCVPEGISFLVFPFKFEFTAANDAVILKPHTSNKVVDINVRPRI